MELELPRVLAPDLSSNGSSRSTLPSDHCNKKTKGLLSLFVVTTSPQPSWARNWVICAPAAFLGCGSHLSGSLSEIEPKFFVTRYCHGSPIYYHRKLIGQKLERTIVILRHTIWKVIITHYYIRRYMVFILINTPLPKLRFYSCISPRITTVIQVVKYF